MHFKTNDITTISLNIAIITILSQISIPTFIGVPMNLATFGVLLIASICKTRIATTSMIIYILLGAFGAPVFANLKGGVVALYGPSGGFLVGYVFATLLISSSLKLFLKTQNKKLSYFIKFVFYVLGIVVIYICGAFWISYLNNITFTQSIIGIVLTYFIIDLIKVFFALIVVEPLKKYLKYV